MTTDSATASPVAEHVTSAPEMILVGDVGPGVTMLINDDGALILRTADGPIEVDGEKLFGALTRSKPVAALVARSETPISGMSPAIERALTRFGCSRETPAVDAR
jgi:hypothetical protein